MSATATKAAMITAPNDFGRTANDFGCLKFTAETTHKANAVPAEFHGRWVIVQASGGNVEVAFSQSSAAEIDRSVAATDAGVAGKVGQVIPSGEDRHMLVPRPKANGGSIYFVREADAAGSIIRMILSDREP